MRILFVDPTTPHPYDSNTLLTTPMGGTEATVIRIAEGLAALGNVVRVTQHNRVVNTTGRVEYTSFGSNADFNPTHVVVLRAPLVLLTAKKQYPAAKLHLWCHDLFGTQGWSDGFKAIVETNAIPVLVSNWHKSQMYDLARSLKFEGTLAARVVFNPVSEDLMPDATPVDMDKIVFFSGPHKGLDRTLDVFKQFGNFKELENVKLYIANPGYFESKDTSGISNVVNLGAVTHSTILGHVRGSLCVFHLNAVYPETFGLVYAESNAVGTPFLTARVGAVEEIADHPAEFVDVGDNKAVIDRIIEWRTVDRPRVRVNPAFRLSRVLRSWYEVFKA